MPPNFQSTTADGNCHQLKSRAGRMAALQTPSYARAIFDNI